MTFHGPRPAHLRTMDMARRELSKKGYAELDAVRERAQIAYAKAYKRLGVPPTISPTAKRLAVYKNTSLYKGTQQNFDRDVAALRAVRHATIISAFARIYADENPDSQPPKGINT